MATIPAINLFQPKTKFSPLYQLAVKYSRQVALIFLGAIVLAGIFSVLAFMYIDTQEKSLSATREQLRLKIDENVVKEGIIIDMKARLAMIAILFKEQKSPAPYIDTLKMIIPGTELRTFSIGADNTVSVNLEFPDIPEALSVIQNIISLVEQKKIRNPMLGSVSIDKNQKVLLTITYQVNL